MTGRMRRPSVPVVVLLVLSLSVPLRGQGEANKELAEQAARAFVQAEAQSYIEKLLNQNPPIGGSPTFGTDAVFGLQLLLSADSFARAENDQQRFKSALSGASAYLGYIYAANPAVGLIAQAVLLVVGMIESAVASSYYSRILEIQKEMFAVQTRILDLVVRRFAAESARFAAALDEVGLAATDVSRNDDFLRRRCDTFETADFDRVSECIDRSLAARISRERYISALAAVAGLPSEVFDMLKAEPDKPKLTPDLLQEQIAATKKQVMVLGESHAKFEQAYRGVVVKRLVGQAVDGVAYEIALKRIAERCSINAERLTVTGARLVVDATVARSPSTDRLTATREMSRLRQAADQLFRDYEGMKLGCPETTAHPQLSTVMALVQKTDGGLLEKRP